MKLPKIEYRAVESLGRSDSGAVAQAASVAGQTGRLQQQMANVIAQTGAAYVERKQNAEYNDSVASMQTEMNDWQGQYSAKDFFTADELGEIGTDLVPRIDTGTDGQGAQLTQVRDDIPAHEVYPHMLKQKLEAITRDKAAKISNPHMRKEFLNKASVSNSQMLMTAAVNAENQQEAFLLKEGVYNADQAFKSGNLDEGIFYVENLETSDTNKKKLIDQGRIDDEMYDVTQASRSTNQEVVYEMRAMLTDPNYDGNLPEPQRAAAVRSLDAQMVNLDTERLREEAKAHGINYSDAEYDIDAGEYTYQQIEDGYDLYKTDETNPLGFDGAERTRLRGRLDAYNARMAKMNDSAAMGETIMVNGADPYDPDHQTAIDDMVKKEGSAQDIRRQEEIAMQTSIMSQPLENYLNSNAANGEPADAVEALQTYGRLVDTDAYKVREMGPEAKEIFSDAHILSRGGVDPVKAIEIARENARLPQEVKDQRSRDYRDQKATKELNPAALAKFVDNDDTVHNFEQGFWENNAATTDVMVGEFENLTSVYYERTGDIARAQQMAWSAIKETWGATSVGAQLTADGIQNGTFRAQKYSPERVMNVSTERANNALGAFAEGHGFDAKNVMVMTDPQTQRDGSWGILVIDPETDLPVTVFNEETGKLVRWKGSEWLKYGDEYAYAQKVKTEVEDRKERTDEQAEIDRIYNATPRGEIMQPGVLPGQ